MNVIDLPIASITPSQSEPKSLASTTSSEAGGTNFGTMLENLIDQSVSVADKGFTDDLSPTMTLSNGGFINQDQLLSAALSGGSEDLLNQLAEQLLSFAAQLLNGGQADAGAEGLTPILNDIMDDLRQNSTEGQNELLKLFISIKDMALNGNLKGEIEELVGELPDSIKLKIRSHAQKDNRSVSDQEVNSIQNLLIANLLIAIKPDALGSMESDLSGTTGTHGKIMSKLTCLLGSSGTDSASEQLDLVGAQPESSGSILAGAEEPDLNSHTGYTESSPDHDLGKILSEMQQTDEVSNADIEAILKESGSNHEEVNVSAKSQSVEPNGLQPSYGHLGASRTPISYGTNQASALLYGGQEVSGSNNPTQLLNQVMGQFDILIAEGKSEATIKLKPEQLGELKIHLILENGTMKAVLDASSPQVKELLEANLHSLKNSLESQGFQIKEFNVSVGQHQANHDRGYSRRHRRSLTLIHDRAMTSTEIQRIRSSMILSGDRVVNYLA